LEWKKIPIQKEGIAALFGLDISKTLTSVFGGMITTNDPELHKKLRDFRDNHFVQPGLLKRIHRFLYLLMVYPPFNKCIYGLGNRLEEETPLLNRLTRAYHLDERIRFPPDYLDRMIELEARVGLAQLEKYTEIARRRNELAYFYDKKLRDTSGLTLPPLVEGATYSHYVVCVSNRKHVIEAMRRRVQLGELIEYSIPHMPAYQRYPGYLESYPNSYFCSQHTINLPLCPCMVDNLEESTGKVVAALRDVMGKSYD